MDNQNTVVTDEKSLLAELEQLDVVEAKELEEGVAFHAFKFNTTPGLGEG